MAEMGGRTRRVFVQQFGALWRKNYVWTVRNSRAAGVQFGSVFIFMLLVYAVDEAVRARLRDSSFATNVASPSPSPLPSIPPCESALFITPPCFDFAWSGNSSSLLRSLADRIRLHNPRRPIPPHKVISFETVDQVDAWLLEQPMSCPAALHFEERSSSVIAYGIQINTTRKPKRGAFEDSVFKYELPLQAAAEREITRYLLGSAGADLIWNISFAEFAHPPTKTFSAVGRIGPTFFLAATMFGFVIQLSSIVTEKELKLRQAMSVMGLLDSVYWSTWLLWEICLSLASSILLVLVGMIFQFPYFLKNNFGVLFFIFFLFQFNMIGFAFLFSTFLHKSSSATTVGFAIFVIGFVTQLVTEFGFPYNRRFSKLSQTIWSLFPPNLLAQGLFYLGDATATVKDDGITWKGRTNCPLNNAHCVLTMAEIYKWLLSTFFLWFLLAIYFDNTLPNVNNVRKSWFYFLHPSYWIGNENSQSAGEVSRSTAEDSDQDVAAEAKWVKKQLTDPVVDQSSAIQVCGLVKSFPAVKRSTRLWGCSRDSYKAVNGVWLNIEKDKLFCLLGPNGAGKTTLINCLTGIVPITSGDALVYGNSVRSTSGMSIIRGTMGVCPQFDILWDALTGREHLHLFASIKGLPPHEIEATAEDLLAKVKLLHAANLRAGTYSGGMKRRLSLAVALIGDPMVVYLDEPTTGMDPVTRRHVWDIIEGVKRGRAVVLTTHSMEEADILGDRIGIMAKGSLKCLGTSIHLKSKYGTGYVVNISMSNGRSSNPQMLMSAGQCKEIKDLFKKALNVEPKEEGNTYMTFIIPRSKERFLGDFFARLQEEEQRLGICDIQLGLTTLEEVFLNISRTAELEAALASGETRTVILENGVMLKVPVGAQYVCVPNTATDEDPIGLMIEVLWQQDDSGDFRIFKYSEPIPVPSHITPEAVAAVVTNSRRRGSFRFSLKIEDVQSVS